MTVGLRISLARALPSSSCKKGEERKRSTGKTDYKLDSPTTWKLANLSKMKVTMEEMSLQTKKAMIGGISAKAVSPTM